MAGTRQAEGRHFLFLQGPHGPFFAQLGDALRRAGAGVWRIGVNRGDEVGWRGRPGYIPYRGDLAGWADFLAEQVTRLNITDIVLYGDVRPIHAQAAQLARARGLELHVFEEGYLRPYWISYERGGSNGHSRLMALSLAEIAARFNETGPIPEAPDSWGALRQHLFWGAFYHFQVLARNRGYGRMAPHRDIALARELALYLRKMASMPLTWARGRRARRRLMRAGAPYALVLLQLAHDASFRAHSPLGGQAAFIDKVVRAFAAGAPRHHHLAFKAHPLEDGREPVARLIARAARAAGIADRVHFLPGGKLAPLLDHANCVVTVNSTAAQQALWRGLPVRALGRAVYSRPEFVSNQPLVQFFAQPLGPDILAYRRFRAFLLASSQLPGSYYAARGRRQAIRRLVDAMLDAQDPYSRALSGPARAAKAQHIASL